MFECKVCGLLSLKGNSCPACGSQIMIDLSTEMDDNGSFPADVPGLDEAVASWYDLEGIEAPTMMDDDDVKSAANSQLPFGFQGESQTFASRLPFGVGSFAEGVPFEARMNHESTLQETGQEKTPPTPTGQTDSIENHATHIPPLARTNEVQVTQHPLAISTKDTVPSPQIEDSKEDSGEIAHQVSPLIEESTRIDNPVLDSDVTEPMVRLEAVTLTPISQTQTNPPEPELTRLNATSIASAATQDLAKDEVPEYWKVDAPIPDYTELYSIEDDVVEVNFETTDMDVVVYNHELDAPSAVFYSPLEAAPIVVDPSSVIFSLHPLQAIEVNIEHRDNSQQTLIDAYHALQNGHWDGAARSFQQLAAMFPNSFEIFNNLGVSLAQRAIAMNENSGSNQSVIDAQFESAILTIRESAKMQPTNAKILTNLANILISSGRDDKALGIMNVHNARYPNDPIGLNLAAIAMYHLNQIPQALATWEQVRNDEIVWANLQTVQTT